MSNESSDDEEFSDFEDEEDFLAQRAKWNDQERIAEKPNKYGLVDPEHFMIRRTFNTSGFVKKFPPKVNGSRKQTVFKTIQGFYNHGTASSKVVVTKVDVAKFPENAGFGISFVWHDPERKAKKVQVVGTFNTWRRDRPITLQCIELHTENVWATVVSELPDLDDEDANHEYIFIVDGKEVVDYTKKVVDRTDGNGKANILEDTEEHYLEIQSSEGPFVYFDKAPEPNDFSWYLNFAHTDVFEYYGTKGLFAQDEIQVAEHPALASVREMLLQKAAEADGKSKQLNTYARQYEKGNMETSSPTPILIRGVERLGVIDTDKLYGSKLGRTKSKNAIKAGISKVKNGPTVTNLICMEAPGCQKDWGKEYKKWQLEYALRTAYTSFVSAVHESKMGLAEKNADEDKKAEDETEDAGDKKQDDNEKDSDDDSDEDDSEKDDELCVLIHTGNWGCGAYGNDCELMALIQIAAAYYAKVNVLVYYPFDDKGASALESAQSLWSAWIGEVDSDDEDDEGDKTGGEKERYEVHCPYMFLDMLYQRKYKWREGNKT